MVKRKHSGDKTTCVADDSIADIHQFSQSEVSSIRSRLLTWYDENKRDLPWRKQAANPDINQRAYAVWVSEIMLQQTQVSTVIDYYNRWMKVVEQLGGEMPKDAESLLKQLSGVGKYTAGAIASIAYNECTGLVDGNVVRVFSRLQIIGADSQASLSLIDYGKRIKKSLANTLVDTSHPGDFNQALMELGATVCTPKSPNCLGCPLRNHCKAFAKVEQQKKKSSEKLTNVSTKSAIIEDIECLAEKCYLCLPDTESYEDSAGVANYPRKGKKKAAREERTAVCVLCRKTPTDEEFLIRQRPATGLLANLWEFPSKLLDQETDKVEYSDILNEHGIEVLYAARKFSCGEVVHIFSHIHQTYVVQGVTASDVDIQTESENIDQIRYRWVTRQQFAEAAVSTAMKKVLKAFEASSGNKPKEAKMTKLKPKEDKSQKSIASFFKPKSS